VIYCFQIPAGWKIFSCYNPSNIPKAAPISTIWQVRCFPSGEMKHGSIALIDKKFPSLFIAPKDSVYKKNVSNIEEIKSREGDVIAVTTKGNKEMEKLANDVIYIPKTLEMLTPILATVPLQLFAYYIAKLKGFDMDKPRNLAKSVTVE